MKRRFPPDLLVVLFGPIIVAVVGLVFGSLFFWIEESRNNWVFRMAALAVLVLLITFSIGRRYRRHKM